jgi:hypothetical protein
MAVVKIKPGPMYLARQPNGKYRLESEWNLTDWLIFRFMPGLLILGGVAVAGIYIVKVL